MKSIYTYYKDRLIEISGRNRCICLKSLNKKNGYDLSKLFEHSPEIMNEFSAFLFSEKARSFAIIEKENGARLFPSPGLEENIDEAEKSKRSRSVREDIKKAIRKETQALRVIEREIDEIEKETGRYELFVGYPFVVGATKDLQIKAPLLLFPVKIEIIDEFTVVLTKKTDQNVLLNKALIYAYANAKRLRLDEMETEFASVNKEPLKGGVQSVLNYLKTFRIDFPYSDHSILSYDKAEPTLDPVIKNMCVIGRYSMANSLYSDYTVLEKKRLYNDAVDTLLNLKPQKAARTKKRATASAIYPANFSDYAQNQVIKQISEKGNMVVYGPPGTGKSQTIVNIISDAVLRNKRVLVVSQKKAALDVVFNRLGDFNVKAMYINDAEKDKRFFYERCFDRHKATVKGSDTLKDIENLDEAINKRQKQLEQLSDLLNRKTDFGLSLSQMYASSYMLGKNSYEYSIYKQLVDDDRLMKLTYGELSEAVISIKSNGTAQHYYDFRERQKKNPVIAYLKNDLGIHTIAQAKTELNALIGTKTPIFDKNKYPYARQILAYQGEFRSEDYSPLIKMTAKIQHPGAYKARNASYALFPLLPFTLSRTSKIEDELKASFALTKEAISEYLRPYEFLTEVLTPDGYLTIADHLISGNSAILSNILAALNSYVENRDVFTNFVNLSEAQKTVLEFAYSNATSESKYHIIIDKILPIRIYHEILGLEEVYKDDLAKLSEYDSIRKDIIRFNALKAKEVKRIALKKFDNEYVDYFENSNDSKDYLYQISKKQNFWPLRKTAEVYGEYLLKLFPCWLLSPENVSTILPLTKNLFDIVLFDEASQIFIENSLPSIYRGKQIVVAGDSKQLRPTALFMKRYMGGDYGDADYSTQAALEVESLLDLAVARFDSCNLTYHYRSRFEELIDFSSNAFYSGDLQVSPNTEKGKKVRPIQRIKVDGKWIDRHNEAEAEKVVELLKKIFKSRKENETIGIITFNVEQETAIEDIIDRECFRDESFRSAILKERARKENGEDVSIFVKNIENVQGDERDIIIFSIGYAYNESGKMVSNFGSLSVEGGENRLNVSITRAKKKIYVVSSIEPEDLKTDSVKNAGPKLFKKYLEYVRAVSDGNKKEARLILQGLSGVELQSPSPLVRPVEEQIKEKLEKHGYKAEINLGNSKAKISLAVYDPESERYLVGVQTESDATASSQSVIERDVYIPEFLISRGWNIMRVWNRDWWIHPQSVISEIIAAAQKNRAEKEASATTTKSSRKKKPTTSE